MFSGVRYGILIGVDKRDAALDASFWINAHRAGLVECLPDYFNLFAPTAVIEEIEHLPEDVLLRKWILEGLDRMRLERACTLYERGQLNLSGAARYAGIGVERMMRELTQRGIDDSPSVEQFADGLETLADLFGKDELRAAAAEVRRREETGAASPADC